MRTRTLWSIALLLLAALPAQAQGETPETAQEPARFLIERITVAGTKEAAINIVRAETLLREGGVYSEEELRQAVYRVHRLPFVLDASFALRKGSRRGAYELAIEVQPNRSFFFDSWIRAFGFDQPLDLEDETVRGDRSSLTLGGLAGARLFVGRSGVVFAALDSREGIQAGFAQYDLLHRGILATAGVSLNECCVTEVLPLALDPTFSSWSFGTSLKTSLGLSIPLSGPQSVQLGISERRGDTGTRNEVLLAPGERFHPVAGRGEELTYRRAEAKWVWDTSDDPALPTRGSSISAGIEVGRFAARDLALFQLDPSSRGIVATSYSPLHSEQVVAAVSAIRHWPVTTRQTVSVQARVVAGRSRLDNLAVADRVVSHVDADYYGGLVGLAHAWTVRRARGSGVLTDVRLESGVEVGAEKTSPDLGPSPLERFSVHTGLVFRNPWGRVQIVLTYLDLGEIRR
ncbi:MAG TPA: hypothetical protein VHC97_00630 [Thermoanaerobaculia bacterium]|nr:hypothetical protein [Thermoanaerobaculia bacterium]